MSEPQPHTRPLVEVVARAICGYDIEWRDCELRCLQANRCAGDIDDRQTLQAQAVLSAIEAAGFMIVPKSARPQEWRLVVWPFGMSESARLVALADLMARKETGDVICDRDGHFLERVIAASPSLSAPCAVTPAAVRYRNRWDVVIEVEGIPA